MDHCENRGKPKNEKKGNLQVLLKYGEYAIGISGLGGMDAPAN